MIGDLSLTVIDNIQAMDGRALADLFGDAPPGLPGKPRHYVRVGCPCGDLHTRFYSGFERIGDATRYALELHCERFPGCPHLAEVWGRYFPGAEVGERPLRRDDSPGLEAPSRN